MTKRRIPDDHHVLRACKKRLTIRANGTIVGVYPDLFFLRKATSVRKAEGYLSASYFEYFDDTEEGRTLKCLQSLSFRPDGDDALVKLHTGKVRSQGCARRRSISVMHQTDHHSNPAYARIEGIPVEDDVELADLIRSHAVVRIMKVSEIRDTAASTQGYSKSL
jgi:hypothetical protein